MMLTQMRKFPALLFALVALVAVSCNTNDGPVDPGTKPNAPTAIAAQSRSSTTVGIKWDAPAGGATPTGYRVNYNVTGSATVLTIDVPGATTTTAEVTGLVEGTTYDFTVQALNGSTTSNMSGSITWAPARRTGTLKMYSSNSLQGSGLIVFNGIPRTGTIAVGGQWDLGYDDQSDPSRPRIASPGQTAYVNNNFVFTNAPSQTAKIVFLGRQYTNVNSLDDIWETVDLNDASLTVEKFYDLSTAGGSGGLAFVFASKNNLTGKFNYGKVLVHRTGGTFFQGTGNDKYIEVEASYQTAEGVEYALRNKFEEAERRAIQQREAGVR